MNETLGQVTSQFKRTKKLLNKTSITKQEMISHIDKLAEIMQKEAQEEGWVITRAEDAPEDWIIITDNYHEQESK